MKRILKSIRGIFAAPSSRSPKKKRGPVILTRDRHPVSRKNIDPDALKVLYRLKRFNHAAYLVGGAVRDLMVGIPVKDFDIATDAKPGQVKKIFSNCRLVGRRFRLAHILFRGKFIEVATFRRQSEFDLQAEDLLIRTDNTYGTPEEDAFRRDFTINALFYNIADFSVIDYVGGLEDLRAKTVRAIGDPDIRLREDPIRMLRAIRHAARLGFDIEPATLENIRKHRGEIWKGAAPRILEELHQMLRSGAAMTAVTMLYETGLMEMLLPELNTVLRKGRAPDFWASMKAVDTLVSRGVTPSFPVLYASMMYHLFRSNEENTQGPINLGLLAEESINPIARRLGVPKRHSDRAKAIVLAQRRIMSVNRRGYSPGSLRSKGYFPEALDLFRIRALAEPSLRSVLSRWEQILEGKAEGGPPRTVRRRRRRRPPSPKTQ